MPTAATTCRRTSSAPGRSIRTATTASTSSTCATSTTPRRRSRSAWKRSPATAPRMPAANTRSAATTSAACNVDSRRRHDLRRHRRLRRADRRRVGRAARRRPQLLVLRQLRLAQPRHVRPGRPPLDAGLLSRRVPARLRDGARHGRHGARKAVDVLTPQEIVDGLRSGNSFTASGQLIDRLAFVACADTRCNDCARQRCCWKRRRSLAAREQHRRRTSATARRWARSSSCKPGQEVVVAIVGARSVGHELLAVHLRESVAGAGRHHAAAQQAGARSHRRDPRPGHAATRRRARRTTRASGRTTGSTNPNMDNVPAGAKNTTAAILRTFNSGTGSGAGDGAVQGDDVPHSARERVAVPASARHEPAGHGAVRDRCRRQSAAGLCDQRGAREPDASPAAPTASPGERATCGFRARRVGTTDFDGCPAHLPVVNGQKYVELRRRGMVGPVVLQQSDLHRSQGSARRRGREVTTRRCDQSAARQRAALSRFQHEADDVTPS